MERENQEEEKNHLDPPPYQYPNSQQFSQPFQDYNFQAQQWNFNSFVHQTNLPSVVVPANAQDLKPFGKRPIARTCPSCSRQVSQ